MRGTQSMPNGFLPTRRAGAALVGKNPFGIALNPRAAATINQPLINHQSTFSPRRKQLAEFFLLRKKLGEFLSRRWTNSASFVSAPENLRVFLCPRRTQLGQLFRAGKKLDDFLSRRGKSSASSFRAGITPASFFFRAGPTNN